MAERAELIQQRFPDLAVQLGPAGGVEVAVPAERLLEVSRYLHQQGFDYLNNLTGVDYPPERLQLVIHVSALRRGSPVVTVRVDLARDNPVVPSVTGVWPAANWHEREAYDLLGIKFDGHPDLTRILLWDGFEGHPLRKDFVDRRPERPRVTRTH